MPISLSKCKCTNHVMCKYHVTQLALSKRSTNRDILDYVITPRRTRFVKS